jgi:ABC-2 type transport system ATP-binding protein
MNEATAAVEACELRKSYRSRAGEVRALDGLSFAAEAGTVFALLGPNGAGKTTTVRILTTLSRPDAGRAVVAGIDVLKRPGRVRSAIGAVSQHSGAVSLLTGYENLVLQGRIYGMPRRELRRRAAELLDQFGLAEAAGRQVRTYSGGMRRRLDVATALVHRPAVLFLDEPTTGLDPEGRATWRRPTSSRPRSRSPTAAGSSPRAPPTSSRPGCTATRCCSSSAARTRWSGPRRLSPRFRRSARPPPTAP